MSTEQRTVDDLAADLGVSIPEVLEAAGHFTTQPREPSRRPRPNEDRRPYRGVPHRE